MTLEQAPFPTFMGRAASVTLGSLPPIAHAASMQSVGL